MVEFYSPASLTGAQFDICLSSGWFRSSCMLHHSKVICLGNKVQSIINIRMALSRHVFSKSQQKILNKNEAVFRHEIRPFFLDENKERLYVQHKQRFKGFIAPSLEVYLFSEGNIKLFDSWEVSVYDHEGRLAAFSIFDLGNESAASILGIFDDDFAKYSLGIYTMMLEIGFCSDRGMKYYYPGYILDGMKDFDYKLKLGEFEYYDWVHKLWDPIAMLNNDALLGNMLEKKMHLVQKALKARGLESVLEVYPYFSFGYVQSWGKGFYRCPFLLRVGADGEKVLAIEFDVEKSLFSLCYLNKRGNFFSLAEVEVCKEELESNTLQKEMYEYEQIILATPSLNALLAELIALEV